MLAATDLVRLEVTAQVSGESLLVVYRLTNSGQQSLIAFDGAGGTGDDAPADLSKQLYVSWAEGSARILRIRPGPHPTKRTDTIFLPAVSEVKAGETRQVKFRLTLPLKERSEYTPDFSGATYETRPVSKLELRIGYFWKTPGAELTPLGAPGVFRVTKGLASLSDTKEVSATAAASFPLMVRTDQVFLRM
jgi:hypothetical protein